MIITSRDSLNGMELRLAGGAITYHSEIVCEDMSQSGYISESEWFKTVQASCLDRGESLEP